MGLFGKKKDPLHDRESSLSSEISGLEAQIRQLKTVLGQAENGDQATRPPSPNRSSGPKPPPGDQEPVFEPVDQGALQDTSVSNPFRQSGEQRSIHREGSVSFWEKLTRFFRGPTSSNPKLVSYLAAGNIHGLRPLRYEKRIHRNRTLLWVAILLVALIGLVKMLIR